MTVHHASHQQRIDAGLGFDWNLLPAWLMSAQYIQENQIEARLRREQNSHRGLKQFQQLKRLWCRGVNQYFLNEISALENLELLYAEKLTATDLSPLARLTNLRTLMILGAASIDNLDWIKGCKNLTAFSVENCKNVHVLEPLSRMTTLTALGIEGGIWEPMRVPTLSLLSGLDSLEYLFMTNLRVGDSSLKPLHRLSKLKVVQCGDFFCVDEFRALAVARPELQCDWFLPGE